MGGVLGVEILLDRMIGMGGEGVDTFSAPSKQR
jgi:hypothetical protein